MEITGAVPLFMARNEGISPVPLAARPMLVVLFVQVYVVVPSVLMVVNSIWEVNELSHNTWLAGRFTCPVGFTVMEKVRGGPSQVTEPFEK